MRRFINYAACVFLTACFFASCSKDTLNPEEPNPIDPPVEGSSILLPKKEMRSVWVTTAWGLDWPQTVYSVDAQKKQYIAYLDKFKALNMNTIFFQVKALGDAFYSSSYEPWSAAITGVRGRDPGYDVLKFMIDEAHARGIEFHAWMNPYRISTRSGTSANYPSLHPSVNSDWVVSHEKIQIYNPALPEVRQRLSDIVKELIQRYDVDGIHFDDYFYPDPSTAGTMISDQADFIKYGAEYNSIQNFRRGNVDKAIKAVYDVIVATKPEVVFSVSPAPSRDYNFNTLYADVVKWCQEGWIDVVIPQLYQEIGNTSNDFQLNLSFWAQYNYKAALMIGHGFYKFGDPTSPAAFQSTNELQRQFDMTKRNKKVVGNAMYSAKYIMDNKILITDKLSSIYNTPSVQPFLGRKIAAEPETPSNVRIENGELLWNTSGNVKSVVYYFEDVKKEGRVFATTSDFKVAVDLPGHYVVTTLNVDNLESKPSTIIQK